MTKLIVSFVFGAVLAGAVVFYFSTKLESHAGHGHQDEDPHDHGSEGGGSQAHQGHGDEEKVAHLSPEEMKEFGVELAEAAPGRLQIGLPLTGEIVLNADRLAHVVPRVSGVVREVKVHLGDTVRAGDVMAVIDSRELADARGSYLASRERLSLAQATFDREEDLYKKKVSSGQSYLEAKQALAEAKINLRSADQKLHALGYTHEEILKLPEISTETLTEYNITAPLEGTVIDKHITQGEALTGDADAFLVANLGTVWVDLSIYQKDLARVRTGQRVRISAGPQGPSGEGTISYLRPVIGEATRTTLARFVHSNPEGLWKPGLFVTADLIVEVVSADILVPKSAIQTFEGKDIIFVQVKDEFHPEPVKRGRANRTHVEIISGLPAGARYVAKGGFVLKAELSKGSFGDGHSH